MLYEAFSKAQRIQTYMLGLLSFCRLLQRTGHVVWHQVGGDGKGESKCKFEQSTILLNRLI